MTHDTRNLFQGRHLEHPGLSPARKGTGIALLLARQDTRVGRMGTFDTQLRASAQHSMRGRTMQG